MIPQLITELFESKELPAARELAIAYLRREKDEQIMFLLAAIGLVLTPIYLLSMCRRAVSYTHLTLPTIYSV